MLFHWRDEAEKKKKKVKNAGKEMRKMRNNICTILSIRGKMTRSRYRGRTKNGKR